MINYCENYWWLLSFEFIAVVSFQSVLANSNFWFFTTNLISKSFFSFGSHKTWTLNYSAMKISEVVCSIFFFLTAPVNILFIGCCHCFSFHESACLHYLSGLFIDSFIMLRIYDNIWMCHILVQWSMTLTLQLENCSIVKSSRTIDTPLYKSIQCAHNICHSEILSLMGCDAVSQCKQFLWLWRFLSPSKFREPTKQRHNFNKRKDLNSHQHHSENLICQVSQCCKSTCGLKFQATLGFMH